MENRNSTLYLIHHPHNTKHVFHLYFSSKKENSLSLYINDDGKFSYTRYTSKVSNAIALLR